MNTQQQPQQAPQPRGRWSLFAPRQARRGVLLLVILSLLVVFLMTAVAFVVVARNFHISTKAASKVERIDEPGRDLLDSALYDLLRDTTNPQSRVRFHSLLRDLYGDDGFVVGQATLVAGAPRLIGVSSVAGTGAQPRGGQFLDLRVEFNPALLPLAKVESYYNGHVLTMIDGPAAGLSTRIVHYERQDPGGGRMPQALFRVLAFQNATQSPVQLLPQPGDRFSVNGRPFNGTGIGYNRDGTGFLDWPNAFGDPYALVPNLLFSEPFVTDPNLGGTDEGYDLPDYQNMLLAYVPMNPTIPSTPAPLPHVQAFQQLPTQEVDRIVQPSLHRRALINYWLKSRLGAMNEGPWNPIGSQMLQDRPSRRQALAAARQARRVILRPLVADHPKFPRLPSLINGPWDVDNDGDGVPDSIWVDFGYPPVKMGDGRFYKPMFAVLVQDLDGRLNLNAHGSREEVVDGQPRPPSEANVVLASADVSSPRTAVTRPAGQGYGPAEISLWPLFTVPGEAAARANDYLRLLHGSNQVNLREIRGRYGIDQLPGAPSNRWDVLAQMKFAEYPLVYQFPTQLVGAAYNLFANSAEAYSVLAHRGFMTPPDLKGRYGLGVDFHGFPNFSGFYEAATRQGGGTMVAESAYEKNLLENGPRSAMSGRSSAGELLFGADALFTEAELERILRAYDADAGHLADRLARLTTIFDASTMPAGAANALAFGTIIRSVTVRSMDLPVPSVLAPRDLQQSPLLRGMNEGKRPNNVVDLLLARLRQSGTNLNVNDNQLRMMVRQLLSMDVLDNLRLDINRPFGDGRDNDNDGAVDDPDEARRGLDTLGGPLLSANAMEASDAGLADANRIYGPVQGLDVARLKDADLGTNADQRAFAQANARQIMARHLFVLIMLLKNPDYDFPYLDSTIDNNVPLKEQLTALRLAQWAVNAVDFRDADAIMTGFEVDLEPFKDNDNDLSNGTWDVDGDLRTVENLGQVSGVSRRQVLWGLEQPDLLITETLATHDLRVRDSTHDLSMKKRDANDPNQRDDDLDQYRVPQGSLFVELLCTGNPTNAVMPAELYRPDNNQWWLDLGRHPQNDAGEDFPNPVWRLAITEPHTEPNSVRRLFRTRPDVTTFQPERLDLIDQNTNVDIDRYVWFSSREPAGPRVPEARRIFWNVGGRDDSLVPAGHYAVVGPRATTFFGSQIDAGGARKAAVQSIRLSQGSILVDDNPLSPARVFRPNFDVRRDGTGNVKAAYGIVAGMNKPVAGWTMGNPSIGVNVSEPLPDIEGYYREPTVQLPGYPQRDAYGEEGRAELLLDKPEDLQPNRPINALAPLIGTRENVRTVFLQRLADPTQPWNPVPDDPRYGVNGSVSNLHLDRLPVNPYITVDWQPLDLTVFNGEDRTPSTWNGDDGSFIAENRTGDLQDVKLMTRERGLPAQGQVVAHNIWRAESRDNLEHPLRPSRGVAANGPDGTVFFAHALRDSLGYLNESYGQPIVIPDGSMSRQDKAMALGAPALPTSPSAAKPFPWLTFNNRPYVSQLELLQVPISAPGRLNVEHSVAAETFDAYDAQDEVNDAFNPGAVPTFSRRFANTNATFGHLLNFFASGNNGNNNPADVAPEFHRLLEYTGVASRFVGTETFLNPVVFSNATQSSTEQRRPPFNRISKYREPGNVNLNTTFSPKVYEGLFHGDPEDGGTAHPGPGWVEFYLDRRGYDATDPAHDLNMFAMNDQVPTFFAGLYGPPDAGQLVPLTGANPGEVDMRRLGVDMGLLRKDKLHGGGEVLPLFRDHVGSSLPAQDVDKHPYFRYQAMQRLSNLTTTRSNVYAVWLTVGFFEMEPVPKDNRDAVIQTATMALGDPVTAQAEFDRIYPEGMWLTQEMGSDTGEIHRLRGFYIIDRSIPVAFEAGRNHNVDRAILLRRRIE